MHGWHLLSLLVLLNSPIFADTSCTVLTQLMGESNPSLTFRIPQPPVSFTANSFKEYSQKLLHSINELPEPLQQVILTRALKEKGFNLESLLKDPKVMDDFLGNHVNQAKGLIDIVIEDEAPLGSGEPQQIASHLAIAILAAKKIKEAALDPQKNHLKERISNGSLKKAFELLGYSYASF